MIRSLRLTACECIGGTFSRSSQPAFCIVTQAIAVLAWGWRRYDAKLVIHKSTVMSYDTCDTGRRDEIVLALLWANSFEEKFGGHRAWKSLPWDALDRLHAKGLIGDARSRAHSVALDDTAFERGRELFEQWFATPSSSAAPAGAKAIARTGIKTTGATVHQFKITLDHVQPPIWRRIQLSSNATFWELHCALNDAMGWEDAHMHEFRIGGKRNGLQIGVPMDDDMPLGDDPGVAGWDVPIIAHLAQPGASCIYLYDFGDGWSHKVLLEAILPAETKTKYPRCLAGARACPPEDCGGVPGYQQICTALADPAKADEEAEELLDWLDDDFDPEAFDAGKVKFHSAARRLKALRGNML